MGNVVKGIGWKLMPFPMFPGLEAGNKFNIGGMEAMTFMELARMSDSEQIKWMSEHTVEEYDTMLNELLEETDREIKSLRVKSFRDRLKAYEISKAVMRGCYYGVTSDGKPWRIDFNDSHNDDWHDEYFLSDYEN